jgi:hypothetical protein
MTFNSIATLMSAPRRRGHAAAGCLVIALTLAASARAADAQTVIPNNAQPTCTVTPAEFNSWFASGSAAPNGIVDPFNGLLFAPNSLCSFYKWSEQMFLWVTSPAPARYGRGSHVFNSPVFYQVSPLDANGQRTLIPNTPGIGPILSPFIAQVGRERQPVVFDSAGKPHNVVRAEPGPTGKPAVRSNTGELTEIERSQIGPEGRALFLDRIGRPIEPQLRNGNPVLRDESGRLLELRGRILVNGRPMFLDQFGNAVETEQGQAGDGAVLMTQNGSIVYYMLQVNDVYAYFLTGVKNGQIVASKFPTSASDLASINSYAAAHSKFIPDLDAMAVELKSAWVETTNLPNANEYITINATIPTYTQVSPTQWNATGTKQAQLALVGMHVIGTVIGHPEMLWATFEHVNNTPNAQYTYTNNANAVQTVPQSTAGSFLFTASGATGPFNTERMKVNGSGITADTGQTIGPSNLLRLDPWGTASSDPGFTGNNTDVISLNNSVMSKLVAPDIRAHYFHAGTTWIAGGQNPSVGVQVGTAQMANTTMETFFQGSNCFDCHSDPTMLGTNSGGGLSHIFGPLKKLF